MPAPLLPYWPSWAAAEMRTTSNARCLFNSSEIALTSDTKGRISNTCSCAICWSRNNDKKFCESHQVFDILLKYAITFTVHDNFMKCNVILIHWGRVMHICIDNLTSIGSDNGLSPAHFYQTRSAWSVDQGSNKNHSPAYNFAPTVTKFCVLWEGLSLPHDTKFGNCRCTIVDSWAFLSWSLIHGLRWSGLIKAEPGQHQATIWSVLEYC